MDMKWRGIPLVLGLLLGSCAPKGKTFRPVDIGGWTAVGLKTAHGVKYDPEAGVTVQVEWGWAVVDEGQCLQSPTIRWANFNFGTKVVGGPRREVLPADTQWLGAHAKWGYYGPCEASDHEVKPKEPAPVRVVDLSMPTASAPAPTSEVNADEGEPDEGAVETDVSPMQVGDAGVAEIHDE